MIPVGVFGLAAAILAVAGIGLPGGSRSGPSPVAVDSSSARPAAPGNKPSDPIPGQSNSGTPSGSPPGSGGQSSGAQNRPSPSGTSSSRGSNPHNGSNPQVMSDLLPMDLAEIQKRARFSLGQPTHGSTLADFVAETAVYNVGLSLMMAGESVTEEEYYAMIRRLITAAFEPGGFQEGFSPLGDLRKDGSFDIDAKRKEVFADYSGVAESIQKAHDAGTITQDMRQNLMKMQLFDELNPQYVVDRLAQYRKSGPSPDFDVQELLAKAKSAAQKSGAGSGKTQPAASGQQATTYQVGDVVCNASPAWYRVWSGRIVSVNGNGTFNVRIDYANGKKYRVNSVEIFVTQEIQHRQNMSVLEAVNGVKGIFGN